MVALQPLVGTTTSIVHTQSSHSTPLITPVLVLPHLSPPTYTPPHSVRCCLGERSAGALGTALTSTCCLEQLDLSWNNLGVRGQGQGGIGGVRVHQRGG